MTNDPIGRHLEARARDIHLPRTDPSAIAERAAARTGRRRKVTFGVTAVALLGAASFAVVAAGGGDDETPVATSPESVVDTPLEWTVVDVTSGLGHDRLANPVIAADGSIYSLSTQPGAFNPNDNDAFASRTLYRSTDGNEWDALALPESLYASSLAADGDRLYAVGTGPAAGDQIPLRFSTSDDAGASWSDPVDLPALTGLAEFGPEVQFGSPDVAVHDGTTVIGVTATAMIDVEERLPAGLSTDAGWMTTADGVEVYGEAPTCAPDAVRIDAAGGRANAEMGACAPPSIIATLTWEQLDVPPELAALVTPHLYLFASTGDGGFTEVAAPVSEIGYGSWLVATPDGFTLATSDPVPFGEGNPTPGSAQVFASPDGSTWTKTADLPDVNITSVGVVNGQPAIAGTKFTGQDVVTILGPDGVIAALAPRDAVPDDLAFQNGYIGTSGFGPLGWATLLLDSEGRDGTIVHSDRSGTVMSSFAVPEELSDWGFAAGVTVSADAVIVRYTESPDGNAATVEPQRLLVGTPRG